MESEYFVSGIPLNVFRRFRCMTFWPISRTEKWNIHIGFVCGRSRSRVKRCDNAQRTYVLTLSMYACLMISPKEGPLLWPMTVHEIWECSYNAFDIAHDSIRIPYDGVVFRYRASTKNADTNQRGINNVCSIIMLRTELWRYSYGNNIVIFDNGKNAG